MLAKLKTGYPRFFIPRVVRELVSRLLEKANMLVPTAGLDQPNSSALLIASLQSARECQRYLQRCGSTQSVVLHATLSGSLQLVPEDQCFTTDSANDDELYLVTHAEELAGEAKAFWQHTGSGISLRCAVYWLEYNADAPSKITTEEVEVATVSLHERIASSFTADSVVVAPDDVILYPTGMSAISQSAKAIRNLCGKDNIRVAVFG